MTRLVLVGCGAISETSYAPAIRALPDVEVVGLYDPVDARVAALQARLPGAKRLTSVAQAAELGAEAAIVASPSAYHAEQTVEALRAGMHVLVEKPIAGTVADGERMAAAAAETGRILAVGLFRRFFPAVQAVREALESGAFGRPVRYTIAEGGPFNWPAASPTFFQKKHAFGGVLHDLGVHVLDLVAYWFGDPEVVRYEDDADGGLETNCLVETSHDGGLAGEVRLSRDWATANRYHIECERGWIGWRGGAANELEFGFRPGSTAMRAQVGPVADHWGQPAAAEPGLTYAQSFTAQLDEFVRAVRGEAPVRVPAEEGLRSLRVIEACYRRREAGTGKREVGA
ncbi:MAG: Gfo/Idh/MocA family oxidoreductase [Fimbriimonadaceae bacterium]